MVGPRKEGEPESFEIPQTRPEILEVRGLGDLDKVLRRVRLYKELVESYPYEYAEIGLGKWRVDDLHPSALYVLQQNLKIQQALRDTFLPLGIDTFHLKPEQALIRYKWGGREEVLTPPIVEISQEDDYTPVITDGLHRNRISLAKRSGDAEITAVVIKNPMVPLTPLPVRWEEVKEVDAVPPSSQKRKLRFPTTQDVLKFFGDRRYPPKINVSDETLGVFPYAALFRNLDIKGLWDWPFVIPEQELLERYNHAGVLVTTPDLSKVLLGNLREAPDLWGNFAGRRELGENDPGLTAARELKEEAGITSDPDTDFKGSVTVIKRRSDGGHRVGISYVLPIDSNQEVVVPLDSEVASVRWFNWGQVIELMDEYRPDYRLWGGVYTAKVLDEWMNMGKLGEASDVITQVDSWWGSSDETPFGKLKKAEREK